MTRLFNRLNCVLGLMEDKNNLLLQPYKVKFTSKLKTIQFVWLTWRDVSLLSHITPLTVAVPTQHDTAGRQRAALSAGGCVSYCTAFSQEMASIVTLATDGTRLRAHGNPAMLHPLWFLQCDTNYESFMVFIHYFFTANISIPAHWAVLLKHCVSMAKCSQIRNKSKRKTAFLLPLVWIIGNVRSTSLT